MTKIISENIAALALLDTLPVGVGLHGPSTQILLANKRALDVLRMTAEQALGKADLEFQWRLVATYCQPLPIEQLGDIVHHGSASIGVKLIGGGGDNDPDQVLKDADVAMYTVKKSRR